MRSIQHTLTFALSTLVAGAFALTSIPKIASAEKFKVIVNINNPLAIIPKTEVQRMFLKKRTKWPGGKPVRVVDQPAKSKARVAFSKKLVGRSVSAVVSFWQQQIFSGRGVPPAIKSGDSAVLSYVASQPFAIGYVSENADTSKVRVLTIR